MNIKPCPYCGKKDAEHKVAVLYDRESQMEHVECDYCGMCGPLAADEEEAVRMWNDLPRMGW